MWAGRNAELPPVSGEGAAIPEVEGKALQVSGTVSSRHSQRRFICLAPPPRGALAIRVRLPFDL